MATDKSSVATRRALAREALEQVKAEVDRALEMLDLGELDAAHLFTLDAETAVTAAKEALVPENGPHYAPVKPTSR